MFVEYLKSHWEAVRGSLVETIDKFQEPELDYVPFPSSWSVRQIVLHIAHEELGEFAYGITQTLAEFPPEYSVQDYATRESIQALLESVHAFTLAYLDSLTDADLGKVINTPWGATYTQIEMFGHLIEHETHHRGELSLILGLLGRPGLDA
ncbi:MAG: DinB family protein [Chloroflexi bacterium]|nr:DinB family protein [Chloroflexota bacterium]